MALVIIINESEKKPEGLIGNNLRGLTQGC